MFSYKAIDLWHDIPCYLKDLSAFSFAKEVKQYCQELCKKTLKLVTSNIWIIDWYWSLSSFVAPFLFKINCKWLLEVYSKTLRFLYPLGSNYLNYFPNYCLVTNL